MTIVKSLHTIDMDKKDLTKYNDYDSSSETSSLVSDESLEQASGPDFADFAKQLAYTTNNIRERISYYHPYEGPDAGVEPDPKYEFPSTILTKKELPKSADVTTLFLVDSVNRDKKAFPQPTNLSLKLPRVYKNVKSLQVSQVKLLCSFYYFSSAKSNIYLPIIERGRESIGIHNRGAVSKTITIRQGTFGISDLLSEIQTEMNYTPVFYDFPAGFADFIRIFTINGDFSINFNQPGDSYYDKLNSKYIQNPTLSIILSYYWGSRYAGLTEYTIDQLKVAYYYPVLYELLLDLKDQLIRPLLNLTVPANLLSAGETAYSHLIFNMSGINDKVALHLISQNLSILINGTSILDIYRLRNTFRFSLVNRYQVAYDTNSLQVNFITTSLNTSLVNLINNTGASALTSILANLGFTTATYAILQASAGKSAVIYSDMFQFLQSQLITLLGIPFGTYSSQYFNTLTNTIYFQNGLNASGVRTGYTLDYLTSGQSPLSSIITTYSNSPGYWPNMNAANGYNGFAESNINPIESLYPYNVYTKNFQFDMRSIDPSTFYINTNATSRSVDIMVKILPAKYTVLKFRSPVKQSLQIETLPLPYYYRYADYNVQGLYKGVLDQNNNNVPQKYFDLSYNFIYNPTNRSMDSTNYSTTVLLPKFGQTLESTLISTPLFRITSQANYSQFEFTAPYPSGISSGLCLNDTSLSFVSVISSISTVFPDNFSAFLYHDRGAFMADLQFPRAENSVHYIRSGTVGTSNSDLTLTFSTFAGHKYYAIFRSNNLACSNLTYKPIIHYTDSNYSQISTNYSTFNPNGNPFDPKNLQIGEYVKNYNTDFTRLPTASSLMAFSPDSSTFSVALTIKSNPIGYDISGVSNDLTDYKGYIFDEPGFYPNRPYSIDPLSYFIFQSNTPFNVSEGTYFDSNSQNSILYPDTNNSYVLQGVTSAQAKIVHWYEGYSIPTQIDDQFTTLDTIGIGQTSNITDHLRGFPMDPENNIILGRGINAIGFLPNDGVFEVSSFAFKSCIYPLTSTESTPEDPNLRIKYIGVFSGTTLSGGVITLETALTVLQLSKIVPYGPAASSLTPGYKAEYGTWYEYVYDSSFVKSSNVNISGYTPLSSELLNYTSMYYMVPFSEERIKLTYCLLSGSLLPYPLAQEISISSSFFGQTAKPARGSSKQPQYIVPIPLEDAEPAYGPQGDYSQTQSQYQQSIPITTTSIGYKELPYIVNTVEAPYTFTNTFPTSLADISLTTYFSEYSDKLFLVNSVNQICSNAMMSFQSAAYSNSIQALISANPSAKSNCIYYLLNPPSTLQNYPLNGTTIQFSTFTFEEMSNKDSNVSIRSFELNPNMSNVEIRLWGGGGGTWLNTSTLCGGAGAYAKVTLNVSTLNAQFGISTLYLVVGKGGNRENVSTIETIGSLQQYEQPRYGGGGTSLLDNPTEKANIISNFAIGLQGGGFSGLFTGPNLTSDTPLLIVGGGGAAGAYDLGGPGGFGIIESPKEIVYHPFSTATFSGRFYSSIGISTINDIHGNSLLNGTVLQNAIDGKLNTSWDPSIPAKLNPDNYLSTINTYGLTVSFDTPLQRISKLRYYGSPDYDMANLPTGIVLYSSQNRAQVLYSNTSIKPSDFKTINNGNFFQKIFDIIPASQPSTTTFAGNAWVVGGTNSTPQTSIQYSLDKQTWVPTKNSVLNSVTSVVYISYFRKWFAGGTPISPSSPIASSSDGMNWTSCIINGFTGSSITTLAFSPSGIVLGSDTGRLFFSSDGITWGLVTWASGSSQLSSYITRIRYINGQFWAFGSSDITIGKSSDGRTWTSVRSFTSSVNDISYGQGKFVIAQDDTALPFTSGLLYSTDGTTWYKVSQVNVAGFSGKSVVFANGLFVATGKTIDSSSFIKTSIDGINWLNSSLPSSGNLELVDIQYTGNIFLATGKAKSILGRAGNQTSIVTSSDGKQWSYSYSGGFDPESSSTITGSSSAYGPVSILPDLASFYIEIQKGSSLESELMFYELRVYNSDTEIIESTAPLTDSSGTSLFYPSEAQTVDVIDYPFTFTVQPDASGNYPSLVNELYIILPNNSSAIFTGITVSLDDTPSSLIYSNQELTVGSFTIDEPTNTLRYILLFIPSLINVSTLNVILSKSSPGSLQLYYTSLAYNPNTEAIELPSSTVSDIDVRPETSPIDSVNSIIDKDLTTAWYPESFLTGDSLRIEFTFSPSESQSRINRIHIFNGPYPPVDEYLITGVTIYSDIDKTIVLFSTDQIIFSQYLSYSIIDIDILPLVGYTSIYIELYKNTPGIPLINEVYFYTVGTDLGTLNGFSAGINTRTMNRFNYALSFTNGGGGSLVRGGEPGPLAYKGNYLTGGSPAILVNQPGILSTEEIQLGSGGGGGGYYGGGGGGVTSEGYGGAGGGGAGYIYSNSELFTKIEFEVALAANGTSTENFMAPGLDEQLALIGKDILLSKSVPYGQGGSPGLDSGQGGHGVIVITYESPLNLSNDSNEEPIYPSFVDGSKLTIFEAPIDYSSERRQIPFSIFTDSIEYTEYNEYNWVWYSSYLSLLGCSLSPLFVPYQVDSDNNLITDYDAARLSFPPLLEADFNTLSSIFNDIQTFFTKGITPELTTSIITVIQGVFTEFQKLFIETEYFDAEGIPLELYNSSGEICTYKDVTELYCILEYLQNSSNLTNPHLSLTNPTLERIFGGVPRFGYWANPFLVSASYVGFDVTTSQKPPSQLSAVFQGDKPVRAMYGLIMEMALDTGVYSFKDVMAYKPSLEDSEINGIEWLKVSQFSEAYIVRSLSDPKYLAKNIPVQPFSFKNAITARLPLFKYSVYTSPSDINGFTYDIPVQILNDIEGQRIYLYSFQNKDIDDQSTINVSNIPLTSTSIQMNQVGIDNQLTTSGPILGTLVSENIGTTVVQVIKRFGFNGANFVPQISFDKGIYNNFSASSPIRGSNVGKAIVDQYGNYFLTDNQGSSNLYQNIGTSVINPKLFSGSDTAYNSPLYIMNRYSSSPSVQPKYDFFQSKYTNIWHLPANGNVSSMSGIRLTSPYDFTELTTFANQIFYPTHKITLIKKSSLQNPIQNTTDIDTYPSYQHTQMFYYKNRSTMISDIDGKFAMENTRNFAKADMFSGYGFNSYIYNINLEKSLPITNSNRPDPELFNYLAIRGYSPTETFQCLVRFYLPQRYDFGYITLLDLSNQQVNIQSASNVNPDYRSFLDTFNESFNTTRNYGAVGFPGFFGSNITTTSFGDFLTQFNTLNEVNASNAAIISTVTGLSNAAIQGLIKGDLQYILPSYLADRNRTSDPLEFSIPFSTCVTPSNATSEQYGIGYNLGFALKDTEFNTVQRASSFFKILDDYIYLQLNREFGMNKMDISKPENFAQTRDTTAQSGLYNSKLMLNTFGSFATTFVQSPVTFNPPIGKIDTLTFSWYDANGILLDNNDCDWSGTVQIVEAVTTTPWSSQI